ncbi:MAG: YggT family protein [Tissierellaceae bacterium]
MIEVLIVVRILLSLLNKGFDSVIGRFVYEMTEPILSLARNVIYKLGINTGMFDFSPLLAILFMRLFYDIVARIIF